MRLVAENLSASRGPDRIIADLSFAIAKGQAMVVTGPNGIGKSTLLRVVAGLLRPDAGSVRLDEGPAEAETVGEACHYLGHRNGMKRELSVMENLRFWAEFMGGGSVSLFSPRDAAAAVGLAGTLDLPYGYLSAGQQRRIAMARLLVARRPVWILDEPTAALDAAAETMFAGLVNDHLAGGGVALMATHQPLAIDSQHALVLTRPEHADLEPL